MPLTRQKYPHLLPPDIPVWERFLDKFGSRFTTIDYDVQVGQGRDPGTSHDETMRTMALHLSRRRIDAVCIDSNKIIVIEITVLADMTALGQMVAYPILYRRTFQPTRPVDTLLVCEKVGTDLEPVLRQLGISFITI